MNSPAQPHRKAQQSRSLATTQAIREAALLLLKEQGPKAITTNRVAERAGVGIASLYRYYPNKEAILTDIYEHEISKLDASLYEQAADFHGQSLEDNIQHAVAIQIGYCRDLYLLNSGYFQNFQTDFDITLRKGPEGNEQWRDFATQWLTGLLEENRHRLRVHDFPRACLAVQDLSDGFVQRVVAMRPEELSNPQLEHELTDMICRYLIAL